MLGSSIHYRSILETRIFLTRPLRLSFITARLNMSIYIRMDIYAYQCCMRIGVKSSALAFCC